MYANGYYRNSNLTSIEVASEVTSIARSMSGCLVKILALGLTLLGSLLYKL